MSRIIVSDNEAAAPAWPKVRPLRSHREGWRYRLCDGPADPDDVRLFVFESALREAHDYSLTDMHREVGGLLVGGYYIDDRLKKPIHYVEIEGFIPVLEGRSGSGQFTFTHDSWSAARKAKEARFGDDLLMLGWHHTHPGIGLFLSQLDQFIQKNYFAEPWMPALVVDPRIKQSNFFRMRGGAPEKWAFYLMSHKSWRTTADDVGRLPKSEDSELHIIAE